MEKPSNIISDEVFKRACQWGVYSAILHRIILQIWMGIIWLVIGEWWLDLPSIQEDVTGDKGFPTILERTLWGIWVRWDANIYLDIANNGYEVDNSVFYPFLPISIRITDAFLPFGSIFAGLVITTLALMMACTGLYLLSYYFFKDEQKAQWSVFLFLLFPSSYFLSAIFTESIFIALCLWAILFQLERRWLWASFLGFLLMLTRGQGLVLLAPLGWIILVNAWYEHSTWLDRAKYVVTRAAFLLLLVISFMSFFAWRVWIGYPTMEAVLNKFHGWYTNPIWGYWVIYSHFNFSQDIPYYVDMFGITFSLIMLIWMTWQKQYQLPILLWFGWLFWLSIGTKINSYPMISPYMQSSFRYSLMIFPTFIVLGNFISGLNKSSRLVVLTLFIGGQFLFSALSALFVGTP